jgi:hypothetical protein
MCSYPPEDIIIENYGVYLQNYSAHLMQTNWQRSFPFTTCLFDGLDYRETVRNLHTGKIFVRQDALKSGKTGSVIIIFSEVDKTSDSHSHFKTVPLFGAPEEVSDGEDKFTWTMTWWGEHVQESDMAFYSTPPDEIVGPGISRQEYGGMLLSYPPHRLHNIWESWLDFPFYSKAERLLFAGIVYNLEKNVVYVSPSPPSARMVSYARRLGQKVIYIPLHSLNPVMLGRIRRFHVLDSHATRDIADDYIY